MGVYHDGAMLEILELFPLKYVLLMPVLNAIGYTLKHDTRMPNEYIPFVLFAVASAVSIAVRVMTTGETGWLLWFDAVFLYGIVNSLKLTISAIGSYEAVRAIGFSRRRMEVQIMKRPFIRLLLAFLTASVLFGIVALIFGASFFDIFFKITDGWIFGILFMAAFDLYSKLTKHPEKVTPVYIVTLISTLLSACMFCMASMATDVRVCFIGITLAVVFVVVSAMCILIPFAKERKASSKEMKDFSEEEYKKAWAKLRYRLFSVSVDKREELLESFLVFHLVGDSIYNDVDMARPLFNITDSTGAIRLVPVSKAKELGVSDTEIAGAKSYIAKLLG